MFNVKEQWDCGKYTILILSSPPPPTWRKKVRIGNINYNTEIVYDLPNSIGIVGNGNFVGKDVMFI